jgi:hypothetical protein
MADKADKTQSSSPSGTQGSAQQQKAGDQAGSPQQADPRDPTAAAAAAVAGVEEAQRQAVESDPHVHEAYPGKSGIEALGAGVAMTGRAQEGMLERLALGVPEPPKVGPVHNTDLHLTPGGYQVTPAGVAPEDVGPATVVGPHDPRVLARGREASKE